MTPYPGSLPTSADLRPAVDAIFDQGQIGSCTANAADKALSILYERAGQNLTFSRLYLYYYERAIANALNQEGAEPSNMAMTLQTKGVCLESSWPYDPTKENTQPPVALDTEAALYKVSAVESDPLVGAVSQNWIKNCVANGTPVMVSFNVSQSFMDTAGSFTDWHKTIWDTSPASPIVGGHEVCIIGWEDNCPDGLGRWLVQNSWGPGWGDGGFFGMPYGYLGQATTLYAITQCNAALVPIPQPCLTQAQVLQAYTNMLGCVPQDLSGPGPQYWMKQPGATVKDMYYAGMLHMQDLLKAA